MFLEEDRRFEKAKKLLTKLKNPKERKSLIFFSDEKKNNIWSCANADEVPIVMKTKYPALVMVLGVVSNEDDIMISDFFKQGLRVNADAYIDIL